MDIIAKIFAKLSKDIPCCCSGAGNASCAGGAGNASGVGGAVKAGCVGGAGNCGGTRPTVARDSLAQLYYNYQLRFAIF